MDNCKVWLPKALDHGRENHYQVFVSWDNASIHPGTAQELQQLGLTPQQLIGPPANSPDFHEMIEHRFGDVKEELVKVIYKAGFENVTPRLVVDAVVGLCEEISAAKVAADIPKQILAYQVVAAPETATITSGGKTYKGTNGAYGPKGVR